MRPENVRLMNFIRTEEKYLKVFAEKTGIPLSTLTNIKSGRNTFSVETLLRIKSFYPKMDINYIITGSLNENSNEDKTQVNEPAAIYSSNPHSNEKRIEDAIQLLRNQKELYEQIISTMKELIETQRELLKKK